jgi:hypothetical protein
MRRRLVSLFHELSCLLPTCSDDRGKRLGSRVWLATTLAVAALSASAPLRGQESGQKDGSATASEVEPRREAGGRIVVPGETVVVAGEPDPVPRTSSVAT